jgi:carboxymethylenebutenolidase
VNGKNDIPQIAFDWYDEYAHGGISRRTFTQRLAGLGLAGLGIATIARGLTPNYALAEQVSFNDPDIVASYQLFDSPMGYGEGRGYWVQPRAVAESDATAPMVLVVHENRGLNPYIKDVARRLAKQGFIAFAPDALYSLGGYPGNDDEGRAMQRSLDRAKIEQDFIAAARFMKSHPGCNGKVGIVGFCFGGYISNQLAATIPEVIDAAVPFYGTPPQSLEFTSGLSPLLIHLAEKDTRVNATWPKYKSALTAQQKAFTMHMYAEANHGFHNDSTARYDAAAAELAWQRTLVFFNTHLAK